MELDLLTDKLSSGWWQARLISYGGGAPVGDFAAEHGVASIVLQAPHPGGWAVDYFLDENADGFCDANESGHRWVFVVPPDTPKLSVELGRNLDPVPQACDHFAAPGVVSVRLRGTAWSAFDSGSAVRVKLWDPVHDTPVGAAFGATIQGDALDLTLDPVPPGTWEADCIIGSETALDRCDASKAVAAFRVSSFAVPQDLTSEIEFEPRASTPEDIDTVCSRIGLR